MEDLLGYSFADLVPFSRVSYWRLFERYNGLAWPAVAAGIAVGVWCAAALLGRHWVGLRLGIAALGFCWIWTAWAFLWGTLAPLNWPAEYAAWAFAGQGLLLLHLGAVMPVGGAGDGGWRWRAAAGLLLLAGVGLPLSELAAGRPPTGLGWIGTSPDATALATLAVLLPVRSGWALAALPVPALWCLYAALVALTLGEPSGWLLLGAAMTTTIAALTAQVLAHADPATQPATANRRLKP